MSNEMSNEVSSQESFDNYDVLIIIFKYIDSIYSLNLKLTCKLFKSISDHLHNPIEGFDKILNDDNYDCFQLLVQNKRIELTDEIYEKCIAYDSGNFSHIILQNMVFEKRYLRSFVYDSKCLDAMLNHVSQREDIKRINLGNLILYYASKNDSLCLKKCFECSKYCFDTSTGTKYDKFKSIAMKAFNNNNYKIFKLLLKYLNLSQNFIYMCFKRSINFSDKKFLKIICKHGRFDADFSELCTIAFKQNDQDMLKILSKKDIFTFPYIRSQNFRRYNDFYFEDEEDQDSEIKYFKTNLNTVDKLKLADEFGLLKYINLNIAIDHCNKQCFNFIYEKCKNRFNYSHLNYCIKYNQRELFDLLISDENLQICCSQYFKENSLYILYNKYVMRRKRVYTYPSNLSDFEYMRESLICHPMMNTEVIIRCAHEFKDRDILNLFDDKEEVEKAIAKHRIARKNGFCSENEQESIEFDYYVKTYGETLIEKNYEKDRDIPNEASEDDTDSYIDLSNRDENRDNDSSDDSSNYSDDENRDNESSDDD